MFSKLSERYRSLPVQVKASFWFLICSFLQKAISMITTPIFTRIMNTGEYGRYGVFNSWYGIISIFVSLQLSAGVYTQGLIKYDNKKEFSSSLQGLTTVLVLCWGALYLLFHSYFNNLFSLTTIQMIAMFLQIWSTSVFGFWAGEQRVLYRYRKLVIVSILVAIANPAIGVILVMNCSDKVTARILGLTVVELIAYTWMYIIQLKEGKSFYSKKFWIYALSFNLPLIPHYLSQTVLNSSDRIMIQKIVGDSEAGIYNLSYSLALIMTLFNTALMQTISPWMYQKIKNNKINEISPIAYSTLVFIAVINLLLILLAPEMVLLFAPKTYYSAIWTVPPVAMSVYFLYCYDLFAKFAFYYEKTKFIMVASVVGACLNIILNYIFIQQYGYIAAGYTTLFCYLLFALLHYLFMKRVCDTYCDGQQPYDSKKILMITISFLVVGFIIMATYRYPFIRYGLLICLIIALIKWRKSILIYVDKLIAVRN